jgi:Zn-dependent peptidase ImmA (M78 family)
VNRLKAYRDLEGLTQAQLGDLLKLSPQMVSAIESGRRAFAGGLQAIGYSDDRLTLPPMSEPLHRQKMSTGAAIRSRAKELVRLGGEVFAELSKRTPKAPETRIERVGAVGPHVDIDDIAGDVRAASDHENTGPIHNLTAAMERAGVCLVPIVGLPDISGLSSWVDGRPVIGVATGVPGDRFRFTLAHEVGHLLMHSRHSDIAESEANQFAGALLFPRSEFEEAMPDHPQLRDFVSLKSSWGVSIAALIYRAHELDYIDDSRYRALQIQMSKWRKHEPGSFDAAYGTLLPRLVEVNGGVAKVSANLGVNPRHVSDLVNWTHLRVA